MEGLSAVAHTEEPGYESEVSEDEAVGQDAGRAGEPGAFRDRQDADAGAEAPQGGQRPHPGEEIFLQEILHPMGMGVLSEINGDGADGSGEPRRPCHAAAGQLVSHGGIFQSRPAPDYLLRIPPRLLIPAA